MKYPLSVHMPRDVENWLEEQLEAHGISGTICAKFIISLLLYVNAITPAECILNTSKGNTKYGRKKCCQAFCNRQSWDTESFRQLGVVRYPMSTFKEKYDIEKLVDELCVKLKELENNDSALFDVSRNYDNQFSLMDASLIYPDTGLSGNFININEVQPYPSCNPIWTRGLLHDSEPVKNQDKMEDYFSSLFFENPSDNFGFEFTRIKSDERQDGKERDRISFYNKQNLLASDCTERLYERNTDVEKLIAKFDANIEGIWKPPYEQEDLNSYKCEKPFVDNNNTGMNPYLQSGNLTWSFGNDCNENEKQEEVNLSNYKSSFPNWGKFTSPIFSSSSNYGINAMLRNVNLTLSNVQKWSAMDGQNDESKNMLIRKNHESSFIEVIPKMNVSGSNQGLQSIVSQERNNGNGDEEDLLTSAKTHFRPIRMEEIQASQTVAYADGTTFAISNEFEKVTFTRSNSGILYLNDDGSYETPRKYMEFKEREISAKLFDSESDLSAMEEFVPKFRIRQSNEKCCQTEEIVEEDQIVPSLNETDCESDSYECDPDEFFFPGDSELAENIIDKIEEDGKMEFRRITSDCNYNDIYVNDNGMAVFQKISDASQCLCSIEKSWLPSSENDIRRDWSDIWCPQNAYEGCECNEIPARDEYFRFREELTQEGEQLLSDLSCLQQLYSSSKWCDNESETTSELNDEDGANDVFCSLEFLNKFKSMYAKNYWIREMEDSPDLEKEEISRSEKPEKTTGSKTNEPSDASAFNEKSQKERKRRNSSNLKLGIRCVDGQLHHRIHYRFSFCDSANPNSFLVDPRKERQILDFSKGLKRPFSF